MVVFSILILPLWMTLRQSTEIIQVSSHELSVVNLGMSFIAQLKRIPTQFLEETTSEVSLESKPSDVGNDFSRVSRRYFIGSGNKRFPIDLIPWDPKTTSATYEIKDFNPEGRFSPSKARVALRDSRLPKLVTLKILFKDRSGLERTGLFPVLLFPD